MRKTNNEESLKMKVRVNVKESLSQLLIKIIILVKSIFLSLKSFFLSFSLILKV